MHYPGVRWGHGKHNVWRGPGRPVCSAADTPTETMACFFASLWLSVAHLRSKHPAKCNLLALNRAVCPAQCSDCCTGHARMCADPASKRSCFAQPRACKCHSKIRLPTVKTVVARRTVRLHVLALKYCCSTLCQYFGVGKFA
jgi:hypothetical protein